MTKEIIKDEKVKCYKCEKELNRYALCRGCCDKIIDSRKFLSNWSFCATVLVILFLTLFIHYGIMSKNYAEAICEEQYGTKEVFSKTLHTIECKQEQPKKPNYDGLIVTVTNRSND